jgi:hypothetical protein
MIHVIYLKSNNYVFKIRKQAFLFKYAEKIVFLISPLF